MYDVLKLLWLWVKGHPNPSFDVIPLSLSYVEVHILSQYASLFLNIAFSVQSGTCILFLCSCVILRLRLQGIVRGYAKVQTERNDGLTEINKALWWNLTQMHTYTLPCKPASISLPLNSDLRKGASQVSAKLWLKAVSHRWEARDQSMRALPSY